MHVLLVTFRIAGRIDEKAWEDLAHKVAAVPGLISKTWILNSEASEGGGFYLFETSQARDDYLNGPIVSALKADPTLQGLTARTFTVHERLTAITRGPVGASA